MKKLLLVCFLFYSFNVQALEYTDYSSFSDFSEEKIIEDELTDVIVERRYKYYKLVKKLGDYALETSDVLFDKDDYIYVPDNQLFVERPAEKADKIILEHKGYQYQKVKGITYLEVKNYGETFYQDGFEVIYQDQTPNYEVVTNAKDTQLNIVNQNEYIRLIFEKPLDVSKLKLVLNITKFDGEKLYVNIRLGNDQEKLSNNSYLSSVLEPLTFTGTNLNTYVHSFENFYSLEKLPVNKAVRLVEEDVTLYNYNDILYRTYTLEREYYSEYLKDPLNDYPYKDESMFKDYYAKRTRQLLNSKAEDINNNVTENNNATEKIVETAIRNSENKQAELSPETNNQVSYDMNEQKINPTKTENIKSEETYIPDLVYGLVGIILLAILIIIIIYKWVLKQIKRAK